MSLFAERLHDPALIEEAFRLRAQNLSLMMIANQTGIPHSTIGDYLKGQGECFYEIRCEWCGREAVKFSHTARFCSQSCKDAARRGEPFAIEIVCAECGEHAIKIRPNARFCSEKCRNRARVRHQHGPFEIVCVVCGKHAIKVRSNARYCSERCKNKASHKRAALRPSRAEYWRRRRAMGLSA